MGEPYQPPTPPDGSDPVARRTSMLADRRAGLKLHELAVMYGVTRERCRQIVAKAEREERDHAIAERTKAQIASSNARWQVLIDNRREIYKELKETFLTAGRDWKRFPGTIAKLELPPPPPEPLTTAQEDRLARAAYQREMRGMRKEEQRRRDMFQRGRDDARRAQAARKAVIARLSHRWRKGPPPDKDWVPVARTLVRWMQDEDDDVYFRGGVQHWPLQMLKPDKIDWLDWQCRKLVRENQYDRRDVRLVDE